MQRLSCPIETINMGLTTGISCLIAAAGSPGLRKGFPNSRFGTILSCCDFSRLINVVVTLMYRFLVGKGGLEPMQGQASDVVIEAQQLHKDNERACSELAKLCGHSLDKVRHDLRRDFYLTAAEAVGYGLTDSLILLDQVSAQ
jgi:ATP-dependent Clp protease, protease subunit